MQGKVTIAKCWKCVWKSVSCFYVVIILRNFLIHGVMYFLSICCFFCPCTHAKRMSHPQIVSETNVKQNKQNLGGKWVWKSALRSDRGILLVIYCRPCTKTSLQPWCFGRGILQEDKQVVNIDDYICGKGL